MNAKSITIRLLWKEFRLQRAFWICLAALGILLEFLGVLARQSADEQLYWLFGTALGITALYALGCGATMFAGEYESETFDFQRNLPVRSNRFFFSNLLFGFISSTALLTSLLVAAVFCCTIGAWITHVSLSEIPEGMWPRLLAFWGVAVFELFAWGIFFSLILKRPMIAAMLGIGVASIVAQIVSGYNGFSVAPYVDHYLARLAVAFAVGVVDIFLGYRWFCEGSRIALFSHRKRKLAFPLVDQKAKTRFFRFLSAAGRLSWQQVRQSLWVWIGIFLVSLYVIYYFWSISKLSLDTWSSMKIVFFVFFAVPGTLLGIYVFYPEQHGKSYRFLADRGVPPGRYWLGRQLTGIAFTLALGIVFYIVLVVPINLHKVFFFVPIWQYQEYFHTPVVPVNLWFFDLAMLFYNMILIYSIGQCAAMLVRSGILATFAAVVISTLLILWTNLMLFWEVPWYWSIALWPVLFLLATRLRTSTWLLERRDFRSWLAPSAVLVPMIAILVAMPLYRVYSVPVVDPGFSPEEFMQPAKPSAAAMETVAMYEKAYNMEHEYYQSLPHAVAEPRKEDEPPPEPPPEPWKPFTSLKEDEIRDLDAIRPALEIALAASKRPECDFFADYPYLSEKNHASDARTLVHPLINRARQLESEGKLDDALGYYLGSMNLRRQLSFHNPYGFWIYHDSYADACLAVWAARPGQTLKRISWALTQLLALPEDTSQLAARIKYDYIQYRGILRGDPAFTYRAQNSFIAKNRPDFKKTINFYVLWERFCPWERYRALRLLSLFCNNELAITNRFTHSLVEGEAVGIGHQDNQSYVFYEPDFLLKTDIVLPPVIQRFVYSSYNERNIAVYEISMHRAAETVLALEAWKLEHGEYPPTLDILVGKYFARLPVDPISGKPFRYFPHGLPDRLKNVSIWGDYLRETGDPPVFLPANHPFLWSPGYWVSDSGLEDRKPTQRYSIFEYGHYRSARSEDEIWERGNHFPLP